MLVNHDTNLYNLTIKAGTRTTVIHTTSNHPFWIPAASGNGGRWVKAGALRDGTRLHTPAGIIAHRPQRPDPEGHHRLAEATVATCAAASACSAAPSPPRPGVDPSLVLAIAIKESSGRGQKIGYGTNEAINEIGVFFTMLGIWPHGGASLGITNIKPQTFATVQRAFPSEFQNYQWANLVGNDNLDIKTTAYYLKYLQEKYVSTAPSSLTSRYSSNQILEGLYNGGEPNYIQNVLPSGHFGPAVSGYINSTAPDYTVAHAVICASGEYTCTQGA